MTKHLVLRFVFILSIFGWTQMASAQANSVVNATAAPAVDSSQCILAGRLNSDGRWSPLASGLQLLDRADQPARDQAPAALDTVKAVRLSEPALLSRCQNGQPLADGGPSVGGKSPVPAVTAGAAPLNVMSVSTLPGRAEGRWVELRLSVPPERIVQLTR